MSYHSNFEIDFNRRTLQLLKEYKGPFDATIVINCLVGLLLLPKEKDFLKSLPNISIENIEAWGVERGCIESVGFKNKGNADPASLRGLIVNLRHSIAHFNVKPVPKSGEVHSFEFKNDISGFHAIIPLMQIRKLLENLSEHVSSLG